MLVPVMVIWIVKVGTTFEFLLGSDDSSSYGPQFTYWLKYFSKAVVGNAGC